MTAGPYVPDRMLIKSKWKHMVGREQQEHDTCRITALISAFTEEVNIWDVPWKHHKTIPPLLKIEKKSNIFYRFKQIQRFWNSDLSWLFCDFFGNFLHVTTMWRCQVVNWIRKWIRKLENPFSNWLIVLLSNMFLHTSTSHFFGFLFSIYIHGWNLVPTFW